MDRCGEDRLEEEGDRQLSDCEETLAAATTVRALRPFYGKLISGANWKRTIGGLQEPLLSE